MKRTPLRCQLEASLAQLRSKAESIPPGERRVMLGDVLSRKWLKVIPRGALSGDCEPRPKWVQQAYERAMEALNAR